MELVREYQKTQFTNTETEAQKHNAQIRERYNRLLSAEADQLASETYAQAPTQSVHASVIAPETPVQVTPVTAETPVLEQVPQVTEFVREQVTASVFTTEKFERLQENNPVMNSVAAEMVAPTYVAPVFQSAAAVEVEHYALSSFAKKVLAGVGAAVVALVAVIGINTHIINNKKVELRQLRSRQQELVNENARLQQEIEIATSVDTIRAWAEQQINNN